MDDSLPEKKGSEFLSWRFVLLLGCSKVVPFSSVIELMN